MCIRDSRRTKRTVSSLRSGCGRTGGARYIFQNSFLQILLDFDRETLRLVAWRKAADHFALRIDQKFGEIPLDPFGAKNSRLRLFQVLVERMRAAAIDFDLGKEGKVDVCLLYTSRCV